LFSTSPPCDTITDASEEINEDIEEGDTKNKKKTKSKK
jgi:hypothetical protein